MTTKEILIAARAKIADPRAWTKGAAARTAGGSPVNPIDDRACSWCILGALDAVDRVEGPHRMDVVAALRREIPPCAGDRFVHNYNDAAATEHADVLALFDRAIAAS